MNSYWLLPGVACVIIFIWGESIIIFYMMHTLGIHLKKWKCFLFSSVGFFFSCITPSATGGQPAQIYYMKKEKIPIPVSTLVLMIVTITYKMVLVVIGLGLMIFGRGFIRTHMYDIRHIFYLGTGLNVFCVSSMLLLVFHPVLARSILVKGMELLEKMHLMRHKSTRIEKLNASMDQYHTTAVYLKDHIMVLVNVFAITLFQRFALFTATWFVYKAFGLSGTNAFVIILLQSVISVSVDMLPLPGGMGISEKLFSMIFEPVFGSALLIPGMILSRGLGYYTELLISAIFTIVALKPTRCTVNDLLCALINLADPLHIHQHDDIIHRHTRSHCTDEHNKPHSISGSRLIFPPGFLLLFIASLIFPVDPRNHWDRDDRRDCPNSHIAAQTAGKCKCRYCDLHTPFDQNRTEQIPDNSPCFPVSHSSSPPSLTQKLFGLPLHFHLQNPVP